MSNASAAETVAWLEAAGLERERRCKRLPFAYRLLTGLRRLGKIAMPDVVKY